MTKSDSKQPKTNALNSRGDSAVITQFPNERADEDSTLSAEELDALRKQLEDLEEQLSQLPEVNASKVVDLHNRIESGSYEIDPDRLAEKLAQLESEINRK